MPVPSRSARDGQALWVAFRVVDPHVVTDPVVPYNADSVELYLDTRPVAPASGPKLGDHDYSDGVYEIIAAPPNGAGGVPTWIQGTLARPVSGLEVAGRRLADGYFVEMRLPYAGLNNVAASRFESPIRLDVVVNDADPLLGGGHTPRVTYSLGGSTEGWHDAGVFGVAVPSDVASPVHRVIPGHYAEAPGHRTLTAGLIVPLASAAAGETFAVGLHPVTPGAHLVLASPITEKLNYPTLGISVTRRVSEIKRLTLGRYVVTTRVGNDPPRQTTFESLSWAAAPPRPPGRYRPGVSLPDLAQAEGVRLPNGWRVTPAGKHISLPGDLPLDMAFSPDGKFLLVNTAGYHDHGVDVIDPATGKLVQHVDTGKSWAGLCFGNGGQDVYVSGGGIVKAEDAAKPHTAYEKAILHLAYSNGKLQAATPLDLPALPSAPCFVAGLASGKDGSLYAVNMTDNRVYRLAGTPLMVQATGKVFYRPAAIALSPDGQYVAVANWGGETVSLLAANSLQELTSYKVGSHPCALAYAPDGRLFVANAGSNSVSVIDNSQVFETIKTSLDPQALVGSTPDALALSPDGKRLYVANADNNDVAVVDISDRNESRVLGFIPTGWYPSSLAVSPDGRTLYVGTGKGLAFAPSASGKYIGDILSGAVSVVPLPDAGHLAADTRQVRANVPRPYLPPTTPAQAALSVFKKIHHVVYIIRENRTYDQVFGDVPQGNGDPSLVLFGKDVTPNAHALAQHYVLLDNLYCNGEVSQDGHEWCNAAYATDFTERAWPNSYSGRPEPDADDRLTASPAGYLWDNCARHGLTYHSYGEYAGFMSSPHSAPVFQGEASLKGHVTPAWTLIPYDHHDTERADLFLKEMHQAERTGQWPQFMVMSLGEDHTQGTAPGKYTPAAHVAANDQALGRIVSGISRSRFWKDTAIFVIEDDAQDGPDHVDAHRTVGLVISPFVKRGTIDSTFYTTASFVHTMELILSLPVMTQFDQAAQPLYNAFTPTPDLLAYDLRPTRLNLEARNGVDAPDALLSSHLDFSAPDRVAPATLTAILWHALKPGALVPAPVRSARLPR